MDIKHKGPTQSVHVHVHVHMPAVQLCLPIAASCVTVGDRAAAPRTGVVIGRVTCVWLSSGMGP